MNSRLLSSGTLRSILVVSGIALVAAFVVVVAVAIGRSNATTSTVAKCDFGALLDNDISESSGVLPSGQQLRVVIVAAPNDEEAISVRKAVYSECTEGGASLVEDGVTTLSWRTSCGSGLLMRVGENSVVVIVEAQAC